MLPCQYTYTYMPVDRLHASIPTLACHSYSCMPVYLHASMPIHLCPKSPGHTGMLASTPMPYTGMNGILIPL